MLPMIQKIETIEAEEVRNQFSWDVIEKPIFLGNGSQVPNHKAILRSDNNMVLNVCKESYTPTSNELFCDFVYKISQITGFQVQNFNEFQEGKKILAFLKTPETQINGFRSQNFMAVGNAHDSTNAFFVANTSVMIRCQNQFTKLEGRGMKAFHTTSNSNQIRQIENSIHLYDNQQRALTANFEKLSQQKVDETRLENFIRHMFEIDNTIKSNEIEEKVSTRKINQIGQLIEAIELETRDLGNSDFALFHGVTRWTTHTRTQKDKTFGNLFGTNAMLNERALNFLLN
jgi:phage/plasmid-like protein (TIGR03299 family)